MKLPFCVACGSKEDPQHHHLVTRIEGGADDDTNLITLCTACHHKLHERQMHGAYKHSSPKYAPAWRGPKSEAPRAASQSDAPRLHRNGARPSVQPIWLVVSACVA